MSDHDNIDYSSDDSVSSNTPIEENSLQQELKLISDTVARLENFKPETTAKHGRPKTAKNADLQIVIKTIGKICKLNERILDELLELKKENNELKSITTENKSYRDAILKQLPISTTTSNSTSTTPTAPTTTANSSNKTPDDINNNTNLCNRIDIIEQEALRNYLKLEGTVCDQIISAVNEPSPDLPTNENTTREPKPNLKTTIVNTLNKIRPNFIQPENIDSVVIAGKLKKHLKIKTTSSSKKIDIIKLFKQEKPTNIYAQEYLTKNRSELLYKLRTLKKSNPSKISSVYSYNGSICARLPSDTNKIHYINNSTSYDNFLTNINDA